MAEKVITIEGGKELERRLAALATLERSRIVTNAIRTGAELIERAAQSNAPRLTGALARSIEIIEVNPRFGIAAHVVIETRSGFFQGKTFYAAFQELGHRSGRRTHRVRREMSWSQNRRVAVHRSDKRRKIPGKHFIGRAFRSKGQAAADLAAQLIWNGVAAEVTRAAG